MADYFLFIFEGGLFWIAYCIFKWCADTIDHHYEESIFNWLAGGTLANPNYDSYWYHDWTRKYIDGDPDKGRKKMLGIPIPAIFFDGWHLFDALRSTAAYSAMYHLASKGHWSIETYLLYGALFTAALMISGKVFYEGLLIIPGLKQKKKGDSNG